MILRDPIHGLVAFEDLAEPVIAGLLDTREVQRLRHVRQLGLASLVFPGAEHSRFAHALGTAHVMSRLLERLHNTQQTLPDDLRLTEQDERAAYAAALLHDLGHGPFSHLFEEVLPDAPQHEEWTERLLLDDSTDVHRTLSKLDSELPEVVASLLRGSHRLEYLCHAISGTLDVDRCDYLLRDSHMTGVRYGLYDLEWLLRGLSFGEIHDSHGNPHWVLAVEGRKGLPPIEDFFLARNFMYQQVYHHKAVRAAEALVRGMFARATELVAEGHALEPAPPALRAAATGQTVTNGEYLEMDDAAIHWCITSWQRSGDPVLSDLAERFVRRWLPKTLPLPDTPGADTLWQRCHGIAQEIAERRGFRPDLYVWLDLPSDVPYSEPAGSATLGMWVSLRHRPIARLGEVSFLLRELRNKRTVRPRLVFPPEIRDEVSAAVEPLL